MILKLLAILLLSTSIPTNHIKISNNSEVVQDDLEMKIHATRLLLAVYSNENESVLKMFDETVSHWVIYHNNNKSFDVNILLKAISFAAVEYNGQHRNDPNRTPYIIYPIGVARLLFDEGRVTNTNVLTAAILQNVLQFTKAQPDEVEALFNSRVLDTIQELASHSNDEQLDQLTLNSQLIKLADRLYTIRDLQQEKLPTEYILAYKLWGQKLLQSLKGTNPDLELALQQEILT